MKNIQIGTRIIAFPKEGFLSQLLTVPARRKYYAKLGTVVSIEGENYFVEFDDHPGKAPVAFAEDELTVI